MGGGGDRCLICVLCGAWYSGNEIQTHKITDTYEALYMFPGLLAALLKMDLFHLDDNLKQ